MGKVVKLSRVNTVLATCPYPISRDRAAERFDDVTLLLADGEVNLGQQIRNARNSRFESIEDLVADLYSVLPREAVGEPYQSEGEG